MDKIQVKFKREDLTKWKSNEDQKGNEKGNEKGNKIKVYNEMRDKMK